jgi:glutaredoxin
MLRRVVLIAVFALAGCGHSEGPQEAREPVDRAPATEAPATEAPSPATEAPATEAPATDAPATAAPAPDAPVRTAKATKVHRAPVIVYQASWCVPCHNLSAHLTRRGIRHVDKDIDSTPGALDEMNAKLARAGHTGAQLPVMDFRGRIVVGYDPAAVDRLCDEDLAATGS